MPATIETRPRTPVRDLLLPALKARDMTASGLATATGKSRSYVLGVLNHGKALTNPDTIDQFAAVLGIERYDLYAAVDVIPPEIRERITASRHTLDACRIALDRMEN